MEFAACSAMKLISKEGRPYWLRTCDIGTDLWSGGAHLVSMPKGCRVSMAGGTLCPAHSLMGMTYGPQDTWLLDGVNDAGLVGGLLALGEGTSVPAAEPGLEGVCGMELVTWLLSRCATAEEAAQAAERLQILDVQVEGRALPCEMHYMFMDRAGGCVILEAADEARPGRLQGYRENLGLLTNSPPYPQQLENLSWYLAHSPELNWGRGEPVSLTLNGLTVKADSAAAHLTMSGALPASFASCDRFIRGAMMKALNREGQDFPDAGMLPLGEQLMAPLVEPHNQGLYHYTRFDEHLGPVGGHKSCTQYQTMYDPVGKVLYLKPYGTTAWTRLALAGCSVQALQRHPICTDPMGGVVESGQ